MRDFVQQHPEYKHDSIISDSINYDLLHTCDGITSGKIKCPELLISYDTKSGKAIPTAMEKAENFLDCKAAITNKNLSNCSNLNNTSLHWLSWY